MISLRRPYSNILLLNCKRRNLGYSIPKSLSELEKEHLRETCQTTNALFNFMYLTGCCMGEDVKVNCDIIDLRTNAVLLQSNNC